jgi:hypothetical protein
VGSFGYANDGLGLAHKPDQPDNGHAAARANVARISYSVESSVLYETAPDVSSRECDATLTGCTHARNLLPREAFDL